jgi:hypothetical protein
MTYDTHFTEARIIWALSLVGDAESRKRDPSWYSNEKVVQVLQGMIGEGKAPPDWLVSANPFEGESVLDAIASGKTSDLQLSKSASAHRNRLAVWWAVRMIWEDRRLLARLRRCAVCSRFFLRGQRERSYCEEGCRSRLRNPDGKWDRWKTYTKTHVVGFHGDT